MPKDGSAVRLDGQGKPLWLCLELTYRCPLKCPWCNNPLDLENYRAELNTDAFDFNNLDDPEFGVMAKRIHGLLFDTHANEPEPVTA